MNAEVYTDPLTLWARVLRRCVRTEDGCWLWTGCVTSRGYGCVGAGRKGKNITTHRLAVIVRDGSIPDGLTVDHQCHHSETCREDVECPHRRCVNPDHLAVMTMGDNTARQWESWRCKRGHDLAYRTRGDRKARYCPTCQAEFRRAWTERQSQDATRRAIDVKAAS